MTNLKNTCFILQCKRIMILYMFRALYAHHQEVEWYWLSIWYRPDFRGRYQMLHQYNSTS